MEREESTTSSPHSDRLREVYALIWRSGQTDEHFDQEEFNTRVPRLMEWLRDLHAKGHLLACGGGGFENHSGGLTLIDAASVEEAVALAAGSPMNEIGVTDVLVWDLFYADLVDKRSEHKLRR